MSQSKHPLSSIALLGGLAAVGILFFLYGGWTCDHCGDGSPDAPFDCMHCGGETCSRCENLHEDDDEKSCPVVLENAEED